MGQVDDRRSFSEKQIERFREHLPESAQTISGRACIYATGSYGRLEASQHSDLDIFIISVEKGDEKNPKKKLENLSKILVKAELIHMLKKMDMPSFDGDGKYLTDYSLELMSIKMGTPDDDVLNTFSARLLLLLESRPIVESEIYKDIVDNVLAKYWRDFSDHKENFVPAYLTNDILRLWCTLCVNYEARTKTEPDLEKIKRKVKNYKLKYSRLLTCFSTIVYLIAIHQIKNTVSTVDANEMVRLTPIERLSWIKREGQFRASEQCVDMLLGLYEEFLKNTDVPETDLVARFTVKTESKALFDRASEFGDQMAKLIDHIGGDGRFRRMLIV